MVKPFTGGGTVSWYLTGQKAELTRLFHAVGERSGLEKLTRKCVQLVCVSVTNITEARRPYLL